MARRWNYPTPPADKVPDPAAPRPSPPVAKRPKPTPAPAAQTDTPGPQNGHVDNCVPARPNSPKTDPETRSQMSSAEAPPVAPEIGPVPGVDLTNPAARAAWVAKYHRMAWANGLLGYLFHATQTKISDLLDATKHKRRFMLLCSRRLGKSYMLLARAFSTALRTPRARVLFLAPTAKHASEIAVDLSAEILRFCPQDLLPEYKSLTKEFHFKNGSIVRLKGTNGEHAADLRGGSADEIIIDECGLVDNLRHVISDVCLPMTLTTGGRIILATTPAVSPGHDSAQIYEELAADGCTAVFTIRDAPHISDLEKIELLTAMGEMREDVPEILAGTKPPKTTAVAREFFCTWCVDSSKAIVPEFTAAKQIDIVKPWPRPEYFDAYTTLDAGFVDGTGILFCFNDFLADKLIVEDEALLRQANTTQIAECIRSKETQLWPGQPPYWRIADDPQKRLCADLSQLHGMTFSPARNDDPQGAVNLLRVAIQANRVIINPRCTHLIRQLSTGVWNNTGNSFARTSQQGHFDLISALVYLVRAYNRTRNPYPNFFRLRGGPHGPGENDWVSPKHGRKKDLGLYPDSPLGRKLAKGLKGKL